MKLVAGANVVIADFELTTKEDNDDTASEGDPRPVKFPRMELGVQVFVPAFCPPNPPIPIVDDALELVLFCG